MIWHQKADLDPHQASKQCCHHGSWCHRSCTLRTFKQVELLSQVQHQGPQTDLPPWWQELLRCIIGGQNMAPAVKIINLKWSKVYPMHRFFFQSDLLITWKCVLDPVKTLTARKPGFVSKTQFPGRNQGQSTSSFPLKILYHQDENQQMVRSKVSLIRIPQFKRSPALIPLCYIYSAPMSSRE